jgi:glycosyltransferase involved in cell wall biosynthesis
MNPQLIFSTAPDDQDPVLSIITLCYNTGKFVIEGMAAIAPQLSEKVEHIILDDGSNDNSIEIIRNYANTAGYPVRLYSNKENYGIPESKSRILRLAKGEFISDCADDVFLPHRVHHDLSIIQELPSTAAGFFSLAVPFSVNEDGTKEYHVEPLGKLKGIDKQTHLTSEEVLQRLRKGCFIPAPCVCLRKSVYEDFPQDNSYFIEDYPMWAKLAVGGWGMVYSPETTTLYRRANHSVQRTNWLQVDFDDIRVRMELLGYRLNDDDIEMKKRWFRVVCEADANMIFRLFDLCKRTDNKPGLLFFLARMKLPRRLLWIFSNQSLKYHFWRYI